MTAHLYIYGDIISPQNQLPGNTQGVSLSAVIQAIQAQGRFNELIVHIHSRGGEVTEGFAIYNYLRSLKKPITTVIEGLCASIATIVALAGDVRKIHPYAEVFIHNPWGEATGNAKFMERYASELKRAEARLLDLYVERTGAERNRLSGLMGNDTTLTADQALKMGFVTQMAAEYQAFAMLGNIKDLNKKINHKQLTMTKAQKLAQIILQFLGGRQGAILNSMNTTLDDGTTIYIDTAGDTPAIGDVLYLGADNTALPATAGTYVLDDGTELETDDTGMITAITPSDGASAKPETMAVKALKSQNAALKAKVKQLENAEAAVMGQLEEIKAQIQSTYVPKPRQKEVFNRTAITNPAERNRVAEAKEKRG